MAQQIINVGERANSGGGDPLRDALIKVNENFTELYARAENTDSQTLTLVGNTLAISGGNSVDLNISPVGDLKGSVFADDSTLLVDAVNASIPYSVLSGAPSFGNWSFNSSVLSDGSTGNAVIQSSTFAGSKLILRTRGPSDKDWTFDQDGDLTLPAGGSLSGSVSYSPSTDAHWTDPNPTTVAAALDRLAAAIYATNGGSAI
jgi:type II secretory pathway pseudopilin PulG